MKILEAFFLSLFVSLLAGAALFIGLPCLLIFIFSDGKAPFIESEGLCIIGILYGVYAIIQIVLSVVNAIQMEHLITKEGLDPMDRRTLQNFLIAEFSLYLIVFVIMMALLPLPEMGLITLIFSIPYAICCTNSIFIFRYFLKKMVVMPIIPSTEAETHNVDIDPQEII